ncbi:MAG: DUF4258 domain-containing protein [Spirochaetia bacterium]|nr:DUF4258 domain-containing protein [Spirochaetia bacterium]
MNSDFIKIIRHAAEKKILFLPHALSQMMHPKRMISSDEIREVIMQGIIIEDYPEDTRGHSALVLGKGIKERPIHIVCSPKNDYLAIITAYIPEPTQWSEDYKRRL